MLRIRIVGIVLQDVGEQLFGGAVFVLLGGIMSHVRANRIAAKAGIPAQKSGPDVEFVISVGALGASRGIFAVHDGDQILDPISRPTLADEFSVLGLRLRQVPHLGQRQGELFADVEIVGTKTEKFAVMTCGIGQPAMAFRQFGAVDGLVDGSIAVTPLQKFALVGQVFAGVVGTRVCPDRALVIFQGKSVLAALGRDAAKVVEGDVPTAVENVR